MRAATRNAHTRAPAAGSIIIRAAKQACAVVWANKIGGETNGSSFHDDEHDREDHKDPAVGDAMVARFLGAGPFDPVLDLPHSYYRRDWTRALSDSRMARVARRDSAGIHRRTGHHGRVPSRDRASLAHAESMGARSADFLRDVQRFRRADHLGRRPSPASRQG